MQTIMLSDELKEMMPIWERFIIELGYTKKQAKLFAEGYANSLKKLPMLEKMDALYNQHEECMAAGFRNAKINEAQALKRVKRA
jgi:hypothetical protein